MHIQKTYQKTSMLRWRERPITSQKEQMDGVASFRREKASSASNRSKQRKLALAEQSQQNWVSRCLRRGKEGWGMLLFATLVLLYVLGFCSLSPNDKEKDVALPAAEAVRVSTSPKSYFTNLAQERTVVNNMLPGAIQSSAKTFEFNAGAGAIRDANVLPGAIGLEGSFDGNLDASGGSKEPPLKPKQRSSGVSKTNPGEMKKNLDANVPEQPKPLHPKRLKDIPKPLHPSPSTRTTTNESSSPPSESQKLKRKRKRPKAKSGKRVKKFKRRRKKAAGEGALNSSGKKVAGPTASQLDQGGSDTGGTKPTSAKTSQGPMYDGPHPMNRNMNELQISENTGALDESAVHQAYQKLVQAYLAPFSGGIKRRTFFEILRRKTYSLTPPGANKGVQTILFQIIGPKVYLLDPYEVRKNSKPFYRSRIKELIWLLSEVAKGGKVPDTEFLLAIHDCVQTVNKDHTYRGSVYKESSPTFTIVSCNFSDNVPFPMWEGDEVRGGLKSWDEKMGQYQKADTTPWAEKTEQAVFRGGYRPSMYFKKKSDANEHCDVVGRSRLQHISEKTPELFDVGVSGTCGGKTYALSRLSEADHHKYKYILYAEGNCFWADRLNKQVFGPSAIIKQETPCGQFWEPLLRPMTHYIPTDFFFENTADQVMWAKNNDEKVRTIVKNANEFASNFLSFKGIKTYVEVLLAEYTKLLDTKEIKAEKGSEDVTV